MIKSKAQHQADLTNDDDFGDLDNLNPNDLQFDNMPESQNAFEANSENSNEDYREEKGKG